ncbi:hypothetical protein EIW28_05580 [Glycomyces terrestris]|uniref:Uncharacterized protein n=1 Tax=Glycomyces terrestris TaxID=2493553 RepID=A0A426UZS1_9ACTN|nr:hypothetical protein EIW28_05580 [Glycomyces terrestris]
MTVGAGCGVRGAGCGVRGAGCGVRGAGCGVRGASGNAEGPGPGPGPSEAWCCSPVLAGYAAADSLLKEAASFDLRCAAWFL